MVASMTLMIAACGGAGSNPMPATRPTQSDTSTTGRAASAATVPCIPAAIHHGAPPAWTATVWSDSSPGFTVPYALATGKAAAAFFSRRPYAQAIPPTPRTRCSGSSASLATATRSPSQLG